MSPNVVLPESYNIYASCLSTFTQVTRWVAGLGVTDMCGGGQGGGVLLEELGCQDSMITGGWGQDDASAIGCWGLCGAVDGGTLQ